MLNYQRVSSIPGARTLRPKAIGGRAAGSAETSQVRRFFPAHETSRALAIWRFPKMGGTPKMDGLKWKIRLLELMTQKNIPKRACSLPDWLQLEKNVPVHALEKELHNIKASSLHLAVSKIDQKLQEPRKKKRIEQCSKLVVVPLHYNTIYLFI